MMSVVSAALPSTEKVHEKESLLFLLLLLWYSQGCAGGA